MVQDWQRKIDRWREHASKLVRHQQEENRMKAVYVAGPFRAKSRWEVFKNKYQALSAGLVVWKLGGVPLIPHCLGYDIEWEIPDEMALAGVMELMRRCDAVYVIGRSKGVDAEVDEADRLKIPVFNDFVQLGMFLKGQT